MTEEVFRASNLCTSSQKGHGLRQLSLSLYKGEILGIYGNHYSGKSNLFQVISGERKITSGLLIWEGSAERKRPVVTRLSKDFSILDEMTVWENLLILWGEHFPLELLNVMRLKHMMRLLLEDYEITIDINRKAQFLSPMEKLLLETLAARHRKTKILLIDVTGIEGTMQEYANLKKLLTQLKQEGLAVILFSHQISITHFLSDRIAVLHQGRIIKIISQSVTAQKELTQITSVLYKEEKENDQRLHVGGKKVFEIENLDAGLRRPVSFFLRRGKLAALVSPHPELFQVMARRIFQGEQEKRCLMRYCGQKIGRLEKGKGILFLNTLHLDQLIEEMTPLENLCLGISNRVSFLGFEKQNVIECLERDFYEWYGHEGLLRQKNCRMLYQRDRIAINLFRLRFQKLDVIFCNDLSIHNDLVNYHMIKEGLIALAEAGTAVCLLTNNLTHNEQIERYIVLGGDYD